MRQLPQRVRENQSQGRKSLTSTKGAGVRTLLIDDLRNFRNNPAGELLIARTSQAGLDLISQGEWSAVWLDHDLGGTDTINPVIDFLAEQSFLGQPVPVKTIYVHTSNPAGASSMLAVLRKYGYNAVRIHNASSCFTTD